MAPPYPAKAQPAQDITKIKFYRVQAHIPPMSNLSITHAVAHRIDHPPFAGRRQIVMV
ncbi:MAG: hypothetical protein MO846_08155 [Candidatus Devosia symbiotica]|nr:hypothetical protein [Candidatus Devosia symbiotica]